LTRRRLARYLSRPARRFRAVSGSSPVRTILDLPSGHGRVLRYFRAAFPDALIAACDVDTDAVDFCARSFAAKPIYSTIDIEAIPLEGTYDLIWCGSLFTHIHADQWHALLQLFSAHLSDSGLLTRSSSASPTGENNQVLADGQLEVEGVGLRHDAKPRSDLRALRCRVLAEDGERA
jgi:SAM-dependent methyltransferase